MRTNFRIFSFLFEFYVPIFIFSLNLYVSIFISFIFTINFSIFSFNFSIFSLNIWIFVYCFWTFTFYFLIFSFEFFLSIFFFEFLNLLIIIITNYGKVSNLVLRLYSCGPKKRRTFWNFFEMIITLWVFEIELKMWYR